MSSTYVIRGPMAGITQKSCDALFPLWSHKKKLPVSVFGRRGRADLNQQKHKKLLSLKLVSAIFIKFLFFHQMIALQEL